MKAIITHVDKAKGYILDGKPVGWVFEKASSPNYFRSYVVETWVQLVPTGD